MKRQFALATLIVVVSSFTVQSQDKTPKSKPDVVKKPTDTKPAKPTPFDNVKGYKVHSLAGFTVIVSNAVLEADTKKFKRQPLECLELELKNVVGLMNTKSADALRNVPIWAEWEEKTGVSNGRAGQAYAVYYGGNQRSMLGNGMEPLKAKCVTLLLTKMLTQSYQEKDRPETLVMLHELAHAVHDQLLGSNNPNVKTAYSQAMSRKLYDKSLYIATNDHEFFAEASCAYLDRLDYFPKSRDDLKKHDPETFKVIESVWGKAANATSGSAKNKRPSDGSDEFGMEIPLSKVKWTKPLLGEAFSSESAKGRVVILGYVAHDQLAIINRLKAWRDEFEPYGLSIVLSNAEYKSDPAEVAGVVRKLNLPFPFLEPVFLPVKDGRLRAEKAGHAVLFDSTGKVVFRGQADDATVYLKEALGKRMLDISGVSEGTVPKQLLPGIEALKNGESYVVVAGKFQPFVTNSDVALADPAKKLLNVIVEPGTKSLAEAVAMKKSDPLEAFLLAEKVSVQFKGLSVANKAATLAQDLKLDKSVQAELKARKDLDPILKLDALLSGQPGSFDPTSQRFRSQNAGALKQLQAAWEQMKKTHPNAKATQKAEAIAKEYGVD